jgi:ABC-type bacteriocin/lantibiotic exporter with double-glycine peptidase domain
MFKRLSILLDLLLAFRPKDLAIVFLLTFILIPFDYLSFALVRQIANVNFSLSIYAASYSLRFFGLSISFSFFSIVVVFVAVLFFTSILKVLITIAIQTYSSRFDYDRQIKGFSSILRSGPQHLASSSMNGYLAVLRNISDMKSGVVVPFLTLISSIINLSFLVAFLLYLTPSSLLTIFLLSGIYYICYFRFLSPILSAQSDRLSFYYQQIYSLPASISANYKTLILDSTLPIYFEKFSRAYSILKTTDSLRSILLSVNRPVLEFVSLSSVCAFIIFQSFLGNQSLLASQLSLLLLAFFKILPLSAAISSSFGYLKSNEYLVDSSLGLCAISESCLPIALTKDSRPSEFLVSQTSVSPALDYTPYSLDVRTLTFGFTPDLSLFTDFSYKFVSSSLYIITGPSGVGKSTFFDLLSGLVPSLGGDICFTNPSRGQALTLRRSTVNSWRQLFSFVQQRTSILEDDVHSFMVNPHVALRDIYPAYTIPAESQVIDALSSYELSQFYRSPDDPSAYYPVLNYGANFSGGQLQRLALAKVSLVPDPIILMDEPTSALDPFLTHLAARNISNLASSKIVIVISHDSTFLGHFSISSTERFAIHRIDP